MILQQMKNIYISSFPEKLAQLSLSVSVVLFLDFQLEHTLALGTLHPGMGAAFQTS